MGLFDWVGMMSNYEARKVARFEEGDLLISTARVTDSTHPFETAVGHPSYNQGELVIVELYETRADAEAGHARWVKTMTAPKLPASLQDVSTCDVARCLDAVAAAVNKADWRKMPAETGQMPTEAP